MRDERSLRVVELISLKVYTRQCNTHSPSVTFGDSSLRRELKYIISNIYKNYKRIFYFTFCDFVTYKALKVCYNKNARKRCTEKCNGADLVVIFI